jgi:hypothetical protein
VGLLEHAAPGGARSASMRTRARCRCRRRLALPAHCNRRSRRPTTQPSCDRRSANLGRECGKERGDDGLVSRFADPCRPGSRVHAYLAGFAADVAGPRELVHVHVALAQTGRLLTTFAQS